MMKVKPRQTSPKKLSQAKLSLVARLIWVTIYTRFDAFKDHIADLRWTLCEWGNFWKMTWDRIIIAIVSKKLLFEKQSSDAQKTTLKLGWLNNLKIDRQAVSNESSPVMSESSQSDWPINVSYAHLTFSGAISTGSYWQDSWGSAKEKTVPVGLQTCSCDAITVHIPLW